MTISYSWTEKPKIVPGKHRTKVDLFKTFPANIMLLGNSNDLVVVRVRKSKQEFEVEGKYSCRISILRAIRKVMPFERLNKCMNTGETLYLSDRATLVARNVDGRWSSAVDTLVAARDLKFNAFQGRIIVGAASLAGALSLMYEQDSLCKPLLRVEGELIWTSYIGLPALIVALRLGKEAMKEYFHGVPERFIEPVMWYALKEEGHTDIVGWWRKLNQELPFENLGTLIRIVEAL